MDRSELLDLVRAEGTALLSHARAAGLDAPVPDCPEWDVRRLVQHMAKVHQRTEAVVRTQAAVPPRSSEFPRFADDEALFDQATATLDRLVTTLAAADPSAPAWNFTGTDEVAAFWFRRMAHETAIHRVDTERAAGRVATPVGTDAAVDGIDELLAVMLPGFFPTRSSELAATIHVHCTDAEGEWMVTFADGQVQVSREHGKGDLAVRGPAAGLFLFVWNRTTVEAGGLQTFGDPTLLDDWAALVP
jgi:uncharacterized protein (TIGR03083 family)